MYFGKAVRASKEGELPGSMNKIRATNEEAYQYLLKIPTC